MLKTSYAGCFGLYSGISLQFTLEMCAAAKIAKKFTKNPSFGSSRSLKVINVDKSKKPATSACYDKPNVCTYRQPFSHLTSQQWQNNVFLRGTLL